MSKASVAPKGKPTKRPKAVTEAQRHARAQGVLRLLHHRVQGLCDQAVGVLGEIIADDDRERHGYIVDAALKLVADDLQALSNAARVARDRPAELSATVAKLRRSILEEAVA